MVIKTRDRLIEVARKLFLNKGIENTTMIDVANASDNGRRTVYSYFKNKSDIYSAVIERESENHVKAVKEIAAENISPCDKLEKFIDERFNALTEASKQKESILSWLTLDFSKNEKIKKAVFAKEEEIIKSIISEGISSGDFDEYLSTSIPHTLPIMIRTIWNENKDIADDVAEKNKRAFISFVLNGLQKH